MSCWRCATQGRGRRRGRSPATPRCGALDLADLASVRAFADGFEGDIDVLINNAGVMAVPQSRPPTASRCRSAPTTSATSRSPTCCCRGSATASCRSPRARTASARSASTTSTGSSAATSRGAPTASRSSRTCCSRASCSAASPRPARTCARSAAHPGYAATNLQSHTGSGSSTSACAIGNRLIAQSDEQGAWPTLYAATQDIPGNSYVGPDGFQERRGHPTLVGRSERGEDADVARRLWELSEELTHVSFPLTPQPLTA